MKNVNDGLRRAAEKGNEAALKTLLLNLHCNPKDADSRGKTALIIAASGGYTSCMQLLLPVSDALAKDEEGSSALMCAALYGHAPCVQLLLAVSDALAKDNTGWTALMCAALRGHASCVQSLLPVSDIFAKTQSGRTVSSIVTEKGYLELGQLIDAYALAMSELAALRSFTLPATARTSRSLRV